MLDSNRFQELPEGLTPSPRILLEPPEQEASKKPEASPEVSLPSVEGSGSELAIILPRSAKELSEIYNVSDRTIQMWFKTVCEAYDWLDMVELRVGSSNKLRYTPLCQGLIADYRASGMSAEQWIAQVHALRPPAADPSQDLPAHSTPTPEEIDEPIDVEWQAIGGSVNANAKTRQATPIVHFQIQNLNVTLPNTDLSGLNHQAQRFQNQTSQAFNVLKQYVAADLQAKVGTVLAQNSHVVAAIHNVAVIEALQNLEVGKPVATADPVPGG